MRRWPATLALLLVPALVAVAGDLRYPRIAGAGGVQAVDGAAMPESGRVHRLLFDATGAAEPGKPDPALERAARALNLYAMAGIADAEVQVAVVVHGKAVADILSPRAYRERFGRDNASSDLLARLSAAGVRFFVCGQALQSRGFRPSQVDPHVRVGLSAITVIEQLQSEGYRLQ